MVGRFDFLMFVGDARGIAPFNEGVNPATLDETIHRTFGYGWQLVWNNLRHVWGIYRNCFTHQPDDVYEFLVGGERVPLSHEPIARIKEILVMNANPARMELARKLGQSEAVAEGERQRIRLVNDLSYALEEKWRLRGGVSMRPRGGGLILPSGVG